MILIKTKDDLYIFGKMSYIYRYDNYINVVYNKNLNCLYSTSDKEITEKVYKIIQNKIIELNNKDESGCIDVEEIVKEVKNGSSF